MPAAALPEALTISLTASLIPMDSLRVSLIVFPDVVNIWKDWSLAVLVAIGEYSDTVTLRAFPSQFL
jgi:hypothetical protein